MKRNFFFFLSLLPCLGIAIEQQPWFGCVYEFHSLSGYSYTRFDQVANALPELTKAIHSNCAFTSLDFTLSPQWAIDAELQFADSSQMDFNFRSAAIQGRYLWSDDLIGDPFSFVTGGNIKGTSREALHDLSCPSKSNLDFELNASIGKEFEANGAWLVRCWAYTAIGKGIVGSPWIRAIAAFEANVFEQHKFGVFAEGLNGFGGHRYVSTDHFNGYGKLRYKAVDVTFRYGYRLGVWGTIRAEYAHRFLAKAYPGKASTWTFTYLLPFSF